MQFLYSLTLLTCLASTGNVLAQNVFEGIPVEPRPSEYMHWDAEAFAEIQSGLEQQLEDGNRIWGTLFTYTSLLPQAAHRSHAVPIITRSRYTPPATRASKWYPHLILNGSGTAWIGGERVNWIDGLPPEEQRPRLEGAKEFQVTAGDMLHVPARVWHQMLTAPGTSITYALINVIE